MATSGRLNFILHQRRHNSMRAKEFITEGIIDWVFGNPLHTMKQYSKEHNSILDRMEKVHNDLESLPDDIYIKVGTLFNTALTSMSGKSIEDKLKIEKEFYNKLKQLGINT